MQEVEIAIVQMGNSLFRKYMKSKYAGSLRRAGASVRWIETDCPEEAVREAMCCDGLLLPGGADIEPSLYGREREEKCGKPNPKRDAAEPMLAEAFLQSGKPLFAICRGIQMLNTVCGGTLTQDLAGRQTYRHMSFLTRATSCHPVRIDEHSRLFSIFGSAELSVNSMHHQAIDTLGDGLTAVAFSPEGFIEAVEKKDHPFCLGVQWHPEHMSAKSETQQKLFAAFVKACRDGKEKK